MNEPKAKLNLLIQRVSQRLTNAILTKMTCPKNMIRQFNANAVLSIQQHAAIINHPLNLQKNAN